MAGTVLVRVIADTTKATQGLDDVSSATDKMAEKFDSVGGASATLAGGVGDLAGGLQALGEQTGNTGLAQFGESLAAAQPLIMGVTGAMDLLKLGTKALSGITKAFTIVQAGLNLVMSLNPFVLVVLAIVALIAVFVIAYKKSETFRKIVDAAFRGIMSIAKSVFTFVKNLILTVFNFIRGHITNVIVAVRTIVNAGLAFVRQLFTNFIAGLKAIWAGISYLWTAAKGAIDKAVGFFKALPGRIWDFISGIPDKLVALGKDIINGLLRGLKAGWDWVSDWFKGVLNGLPGIVKKILGISSPSRVFRAIGLNVSKGFALGVRDGFPDVQRAVAQMVGLPRGSSGARMVAGAGGAGGGGTTVINVNVSGPADASEIGRKTVRAIQDYERSVGRHYLVSGV